MSFIKNLFSRSKSTPAPTTTESIIKLRETEELLMKKLEFLEEKLEAELKVAKENASSNKRVALQALKRKKRFEVELSKLQATLTAVETQREALENANTNAEVLDTMKRAASALKTRHKDLNADNAQEIMDDIAEQNDVANEISSAISNGVATPSFDEDEIMKELEDLQSENLDKELLFVKPIRSKLPEVPSAELPSTPKKEKTKDNSDLDKLMQWAE